MNGKFVKIIPGYFLAAGLAALIAFGYLLTIPGNTGILYIMGISARRLTVLIVAFLLLFAGGGAIALAYASWHKPTKIAQSIDSLLSRGRWARAIIIIAGIIILMGALANIFHSYLPIPSAAFIRLQPGLLWVMFMAAQTFFLCLTYLLYPRVDILARMAVYKQKIVIEKYNVYIYLFAVILITIIALSPLLVSGMYYDDALNSMLKGTAGIHGWGLFGHMKFWLNTVINSYQRLIPFPVLSVPLFWYFSYPVYLLKIVYLLGTVIASFSFFFLIKKVSNSNWFGLLGLLLIPVFIQFRSYHDPVLSYNLLLQDTLIILSVSLYFFYQFIQTGNRFKYMLIVSIVLYLILLLTYEISIVYVFLFLVLAFSKMNIKSAIRYSVPYILCVVGIICLTFIWRWYFVEIEGQVVLQDYQIHFVLEDTIRTWIVQIGSGFPLSYAYFTDRGAINNVLSKITISDVVAFAGYYFVFKIIINKLGHVENKLTILILSVLLIILPGSLISLSSKYQGEIRPGIGYLPVFHQYFGGSLLISIVVLWIGERMQKIRMGNYVNIAIAVLLAFLFVLNMKLNTYNVEQQNHDWLYGRAVVEASLSAGITDQIPEGSLILFRNPPYAYPRDLFYQFTDKLYQTDTLPNFVKNNADRFGMPLDGVYILDYGALNNAQGFVMIGRLSAVRGSEVEYNAEISDATLMLVNKRNLYISLQNFILGNDQPDDVFDLNIIFSNNGMIPVIIPKQPASKVLIKNTVEMVIISSVSGSSDEFSILAGDDSSFIIQDIQLQKVK